ncbi:hypothetical protein [Flavobacterium sp.]
MTPLLRHFEYFKSFANDLKCIEKLNPSHLAPRTLPSNIKKLKTPKPLW